MVGRKRIRIIQVLTAAACVTVTQVAASCYTIDPTDPSNYTKVSVVNDLGTTVNLVQCDTSCDTLHEERLLPAAASTQIEILNSGNEFGYVVESAYGRRIGCLYFMYDGITHAPPVKMSSMTRCH